MGEQTEYLQIMAEKHTLNWHTFSEHLQVMFRDLYQEGRHTDVTLVSDDQTQFRAHKFVLSACSPVFKKIIDSNPSQHPLIYQVESILQFMYLGEGKFYHERMREFIKVAQDLEVKEISDGVELPSEEAKETVEEKIPEEEIEEDLIQETPSQPEQTKVRPRRPKTQISNDNKSTECLECGAKFTRNDNMVKHYRSKHEGVKYHCNQCDYQATQKGSLQRHIQSKHESIKYRCNQCDYQATLQSNLQRHIQFKHEGIRYPCNQCDYQATTQGNLQTHISAKHSDTILKCEDCDYQTKWRSEYNKHKKTHRAVTN